MADSWVPAPADVDALLAYLPRLYAPGFKPVIRWEGGERTSSGAITMPYPEYDGTVNAFFAQVGGSGWLDYGYNPTVAGAMVKDASVIGRASFAELRSMLTFCVRGERFADGHWEEMIVQGVIRRILERLQVLRAGMGG